MLPMVGQGALAVECRADDDATPRTAGRRSTTSEAAHRGARRARVPRRARRRVLAAVRGVRDRATDDQVTIDALLAALDGSVVVRAQREELRPGEGRRRGRRGRSSSTADASCSPRDRLPRRRRARRSGAHHGARRRGARARRRRRLRPARRTRAARPRAARCRADLGGEGARRASSSPRTRSTRCSWSGAGPARPSCG